MSQVRCKHCDKLLGVTEDFQPEVSAVAVQASAGLLRFTVKCPRCGKFNHIKIKTA